MSSPPSPDASIPNSAVPNHVPNGTSPLHKSRQDRECDNLASSIKSSYQRSIALAVGSSVDSSSLDGRPRPLVPSQDNAPAAIDGTTSLSLREAARDPRDTAETISPPPIATRPASPYTLNPPIDFDGLSWPSKQRRVTYPNLW